TQPSLHAHTLDAHVGRQAVAIGRVVLATDQRLQVAPTGSRDAEAVLGDVAARHGLLDVGDLVQRYGHDLPSIRAGALAPDRRHHRVHAGQGVLHGRAAHGIGLLDIDARGNVTGGALQIVRHCPVVLVAVRGADHAGHDRADAAELGVAEGVGRAGVGQELAVGVAGALGDHDDAIAALLDALLDARQ